VLGLVLVVTVNAGDGKKKLKKLPELM